MKHIAQSANLMLDVAVLGAAAMNSASQSKAAAGEDQAGSGFQQLILSILGAAATETTQTSTLVAGQQVPAETTNNAASESQSDEGSIDAENLLRSMETPQACLGAASAVIPLGLTEVAQPVTSGAGVQTDSPIRPAIVSQQHIPVLQTIGSVSGWVSTAQQEQSVISTDARQVEAETDAVAQTPDNGYPAEGEPSQAAETAEFAAQAVLSSVNGKDELRSPDDRHSSVTTADTPPHPRADHGASLQDLLRPDSSATSTVPRASADSADAQATSGFAKLLSSSDGFPVDRTESGRQESSASRNGQEASWLPPTVEMKPAGTSAVTPGSLPDSITPATDVTAARMIHQIVRAAKTYMIDGGAGMTLRLDPPHLGAVHMNVSAQQGTVTATLQATTEVAKQVLEADLSSLRQALSDAGIHVDSIQVSVGGNLDQSWTPDTGTPGGQQQHGTHGNPGRTIGLPETEIGREMVTAGRTLPSGALDFFA